MGEPTKDVDPRLASLTHFVHHTDQLAEHTMNSVEWEAVEVLMPRILRGKSKEDIKQLLLAEIDGMSEKRLLAVLAGETLEESSKAEPEVEGIQDISEDEEEIEPGEIKSRSVTPQDPSPSKPDEEEKKESIKGEEEEELDTDEEIDRQLEEDLQDFI
ncbi:Protein CBG02817 [Caenorhabditis briggsae]|uniref:Protein CBG02817 n=1 Tax=Caenorhabditis briggsae TaxID=6238 RepID=A8WTF9_CAEBR|nr:Protein CBG02817 [Caenorhabditis briggsae]CAP23771.2 Protein CBG02817 [Caenorhabditis briggsae]